MRFRQNSTSWRLGQWYGNIYIPLQLALHTLDYKFKLHFELQEILTYNNGTEQVSTHIYKPIQILPYRRAAVKNLFALLSELKTVRGTVIYMREK
uniref:Uncharacterized protein n=1 Tax=Rhizophora mucronata TaxID=61149 RepID=A0A2P2IW67_RHIMU